MKMDDFQNAQRAMSLTNYVRYLRSQKQTPSINFDQKNSNEHFSEPHFKNLKNRLEETIYLKNYQEIISIIRQIKDLLVEKNLESNAVKSFQNSDFFYNFFSILNDKNVQISSPLAEEIFHIICIITTRSNTDSTAILSFNFYEIAHYVLSSQNMNCIESVILILGNLIISSPESINDIIQNHLYENICKIFDQLLFNNQISTFCSFFFQTSYRHVKKYENIVN